MLLDRKTDRNVPSAKKRRPGGRSEPGDAGAPWRGSSFRRAPLPAHTRNTITHPAGLRRECETIRAAGYSTDREEFIAGLIAVAVPVYDSDDVLRAAIALHAATARMSLDDAVRRLPRRLSAARAMRDLL